MTSIKMVNKKLNISLMWIVETTANLVFLILNQFQNSLHTVFESITPLMEIKLNGTDPWDIQVKDKKFYALLVAKATTGLGEAYSDSYIDCDNLEECFIRVGRSPLFNLLSFFCYYHPYEYSKAVIHRWFDVQTEENTINTITGHYDDTNEAGYLETMGSTNQASMALFGTENLPDLNTIEEIENYYNECYFNMRELIAKKLKLKPGMRVLDIGCGYGALAKHLAEKYDVHVTGVTISQEMASAATKLCKGLDVTILCMDYRGVKGKFDRITCIEMFCHVGEHHQREFFEHANDWLKDDGLLLMHTSSINHRFVPSYLSLFESHFKFYAHMSRPEEIVKHSTGLFLIEDWRNYGYHIGPTCRLSFKKLRLTWKELSEKFGEKSLRKLNLFVALSTAAGENRLIQLYSIVFSKHGLRYAYDY